MSAHNRWPDFRLASSLWSYVGPIDNKLVKASNLSRRNASPELGDSLTREPTGIEREEQEKENKRGGDKLITFMAEEQGLPVEDVGSVDSYGEADEEDQEMQDFGPLEMFDSNMAQAPFSSIPPAPEADMSAASTHTEQAKSKKKKKKDKKHDQELVDEPTLADVTDVPATKEKQSKRKRASDPIDASTLAQNSNAIALSEHKEASQATARPRKRKAEDGSESKRRKKRKYLDGNEAIANHQVNHTNERSAFKDAESSAFLHKAKNKKDLSQVIAQDDLAADSSDPQASPSIVVSRRRSQSKDARSRSASIASRSNGFGDAHEDVSKAFDELNVEDLAREAFNEHVNGAGVNIDATAVDGVGELNNTHQEAAEVSSILESPHASPVPEDNGRPKRSLRPTRKSGAAKKTVDELPVPSTMTPKRRTREKHANKKRVATDTPLQKARRRNSDEHDKRDPAEVAADRAEKRRARMAGFKQGRFTDDEFARVKEVLDAYRGEGNMSEHEVIEMLHTPGGTSAGGPHAELWTRIFAELPDRQRQKVINATRKKFHNFVARGTWTVEQEAELKSLINIHGTSWAKIASLINRHPEDLRDRFRNYIVCGKNQRKDTWEEAEEQRLTDYVIETMKAIDQLRRLEPKKEIFKKSYEELIDWQNISEKMGRTRSRLQCITKWKALNFKATAADDLESFQPDAQISFSMVKARRQISHMPEDERYRLLLAINEADINADVNADKKIPWQKLIDKPYRNTWNRTTQMLLWYRYKQTVPDWQSKPIRVIAKFLVDQYKQTGELPAIDTMPYDDVQEMQFLQSIETKKSQGKSSERVAKDDDNAEAGEGHEAAQESNMFQVPTHPEDMHIDPALMATAPEAQMDGPDITFTAAGKATGEANGVPVPSAKETPAKKPKTPRKRASAKKTFKTMSQEDPIEDVELPTLPPQETLPGFDASQLATPTAQKKAADRFHVPDSIEHTQVPDAMAFEETYSSDMDDMEDLPARVPGHVMDDEFGN